MIIVHLFALSTKLFINAQIWIEINCVILCKDWWEGPRAALDVVVSMKVSFGAWCRPDTVPLWSALLRYWGPTEGKKWGRSNRYQMTWKERKRGGQKKKCTIHYFECVLTKGVVSPFCQNISLYFLLSQEHDVKHLPAVSWAISDNILT